MRGYLVILARISFELGITFYGFHQRLLMGLEDLQGHLEK
jgi:hypothetical protein